jgi:hypothetical protein
VGPAPFRRDGTRVLVTPRRDGTGIKSYVD